MFNIILYFLLVGNITAILIESDTFKMVEEASGKKFDIFVENTETTFSIKVKEKNLTYTEIFNVVNDTFYLEERIIKMGIFNIKISYEPKRIRMILPISENTEWEYKGIESGIGYRKSIESRGYIELHSDTLYIFNISRRGSKEDTSMIAFDKDYNLYRISIQIPGIMNLYKFFGFKSNTILLRRDTF